jgi:hypothetical protein
MLRELGVLGILGCAAMWASGTHHSRLGDRPQEVAATAIADKEIDKLSGPAKHWSSKCEEIITRFEASMLDLRGEPQNLKQAIGQTTKQTMMFRQFENDLNAANCPVNARELNEATQQMSENAEPNPLDDPSL